MVLSQNYIHFFMSNIAQDQNSYLKFARSKHMYNTFTTFNFLGFFVTKILAFQFFEKDTLFHVRESKIKFWHLLLNEDFFL